MQGKQKYRPKANFAGIAKDLFNTGENYSAQMPTYQPSAVTICSAPYMYIILIAEGSV